MKHSLTFTDFIVNDENGRYSIEVIARVDQTKIVKGISRPIPSSETSDLKEAVFHGQLSSVALSAALYFQNSGIEFNWPKGMTVFEQLSLFDVKQTASFNNALHAAGIKTDIMFVGI